MVAHSEKMQRKLFEELQPEGLGLEISPYFDPVLEKSQWNVVYTDYIDTDELRKKAAENPNLAGRLVPEVDFVWTPGKPLKECVPAGALFDYAVASHVMEHVPNPIGWLNDIFSVLRTGGRLALFLPDRRLSSDYYRKLTRFEDLVALWIEQPKVPSPHQVVDFMSNSFQNLHGVGVGWTDAGPSGETRAYSDDEAVNTGMFVYNEEQYLDIHCTVWESEKFKLTFDRIVNAGLLSADVGEAVRDDGEFLAILTKSAAPRRAPPIRKVSSPQFEKLQVELAHYRKAYDEAIAVQEALKMERDAAVLNDDGELAHYKKAYDEAVLVQEVLKSERDVIAQSLTRNS